MASAAGQNRPAAQPATLYDYLPYAIALGCTQEWTDLTVSLAGADQARQAPLWYQGREASSPRSLASLSRSGYYFSYPRSFAVSAAARLASSGSASGASGFSGGYSGGGYSGGGGGGGGGGSW